MIYSSSPLCSIHGLSLPREKGFLFELERVEPTSLSVLLFLFFTPLQFTLKNISKIMPRSTSTIQSNAITVFCGSSPGNDPIYLQVASSLASAIANSGKTLI